MSVSVCEYVETRVQIWFGKLVWQITSKSLMQTKSREKQYDLLLYLELENVSNVWICLNTINKFVAH